MGIILRVRGNQSSIGRVEFLDKNGVPLRFQSCAPITSAPTTHWLYLFRQPVTNAVSMRLTILKNPKLITVPFRLKNWPLQ